MSKNEPVIRQVLQYKNMSSSAIAKATGLSQPTVSRALKKMPVLKLGGGRSTLFALVIDNEPKPLYQVDAQGQILKIGDLFEQPNERMVLVTETGYVAYEGLPFYFYDVLPLGFLGAISLKNIIQNDANLTSKSQDWSYHQILYYLMHYGDDLAGCFLLGRPSAQKAGIKTYVETGRADYAYLTKEIKRFPENLGSSVAGEQPKFTVFNGSKHLIVKYSPLILEDNPVATRHRDLLICEHLALQALNAGGIEAAESELFFGDRVYLEITRFDREGVYGRRGVVSLRSVDAEFVGKNASWPEIAQILLSERRLSEEDFFKIEVAFAFGQYIANSDMHNGNLSFFMEGVNLGRLAPVYDMLPMSFMPVQGELSNPDIPLGRFVEGSNKARGLALEMAISFWRAVECHEQVSDSFKALIRPFKSKLEVLL